MKRALIIFGVTIVVLFGLAWILYGLLFDQMQTPPNQPAPKSAPTDQTRTMPKEPPQPLPPAVEVIAVRGRVERKSPGQPWQSLTQGQRMAQNETIRTGEDANAKLGINEKSQVELASQGEMTVSELTHTVHRFRLTSGRIKVEYAPDGARRLRIESEGSDAVVETASGSFGMVNTGKVVSVATTAGKVRLSAGGKSVQVNRGQTSTVSDKLPSEARPIPKSILLRVANPTKRVQRAKFIVIRGVADPASRVRVNGIRASLDRKGRFRVRVNLREGRNQLTVQSEDALGNLQVRDLGVLLVDQRAPVEQLNIKWDDE